MKILDKVTVLLFGSSFSRPREHANVFIKGWNEKANSFKEARKGFFGCHSVCETMKDTKEVYFIVEANYKYLCNSIVG